MKNLRIWKEWCEKVEKHNENIDYVNHEDAWSPYNVFLPTLVAILMAAFLYGMASLADKAVSDKMVFMFSIASGIIAAIALILNWNANEPKKNN